MARAFEDDEKRLVLAEFDLTSGEDVLINPQAVAAVFQGAGGGSVIRLLDGSDIRVDESIGDVCVALTGGDAR